MVNDNHDDTFHLSRRQLLGGIGAVGAASAGAGLGTTAYFSDDERFTNDRLVAGELDLTVDWEGTYNGEPVDAFPDADGDGVQDVLRSREELASDAGLPIDSPSVETLFREQFADVPDDVSGPLIELEDVKPGDWGRISFSLHLFDNPGHVWLTGTELENDDDGQTEPERDTTDGRDDLLAIGDDPLAEGELGRKIEVIVSYDDGTDAAAGERSVERVFHGTLAQLTTNLATGVGIPLDGDRSTPFGEIFDCVGERDCFDPVTTHHVDFLWMLPVTIGDVVQSDSYSFDLGFYTEQCRWNPGESSRRDVGGVGTLQTEDDGFTSKSECEVIVRDEFGEEYTDVVETIYASALSVDELESRLGARDVFARRATLRAIACLFRSTNPIRMIEIVELAERLDERAETANPEVRKNARTIRDGFERAIERMDVFDRALDRIVDSKGWCCEFTDSIGQIEFIFSELEAAFDEGLPSEAVVRDLRRKKARFETLQRRAMARMAKGEFQKAKSALEEIRKNLGAGPAKADITGEIDDVLDRYPIDDDGNGVPDVCED